MRDLCGTMLVYSETPLCLHLFSCLCCWKLKTYIRFRFGDGMNHRKMSSQSGCSKRLLMILVEIVWSRLEVKPTDLGVVSDTRVVFWLILCETIELLSVSTEPLVAPRNFRLDPNKPITNSTADFIWDSVDTSPQQIQGFFRGYKVTSWSSLCSSCLVLCCRNQRAV